MVDAIHDMMVPYIETGLAEKYHFTCVPDRQSVPLSASDRVA